MKLFYADQFILPLPPGHRFPMQKYRMLRERLAASGEFAEADFVVPPAATFAELTRAHAPDYVLAMEAGHVDEKAQKLIGFPWSPEMVERSKRSSGATIAACRAALEEGAAANLAGGTHHAFYDRGEGFCVFNDAAIAARAMQAEGHVKQVAVIDCDVHQGNGTAAILAGDESVFTFSIHGAKNYPFRREVPSDLDVDVEDGTTDLAYLDALSHALHLIFQHIQPELVIYLAGADPHEGDRLGRLKLTTAGLLARDEMVFQACASRGLPVAVAMAGGYGREIADTVEIHANTVIAAKRICCARAQPLPEMAH
jgi:acetoin utilization deacetylase AcuC-like enzyme